MDPTNLVSGLIASRMAEIQLAAAARIMRTGAGAGSAVAKLVDAANKNASSLANVAAGIGRNLDVSV